LTWKHDVYTSLGYWTTRNQEVISNVQTPQNFPVTVERNAEPNLSGDNVFSLLLSLKKGKKRFAIRVPHKPGA
jgi:hypothetical protein